jgi:hypothetical protein
MENDCGCVVVISELLSKIKNQNRCESQRVSSDAELMDNFIELTSHSIIVEPLAELIADDVRN